MAFLYLYLKIALAVLVGLALLRLVRPAVYDRVMVRYSGDPIRGWRQVRAIVEYAVGWPILALHLVQWLLIRAAEGGTRLVFIVRGLWRTSAARGAEVRENLEARQARQVAGMAARTI
ncbi:hypothetical protein [Acrocarpospora catenulata]|uniref:hypothetical protein n=1 Tax=Acrocarpospora catenulata TaxID=2836182 RepID=UPI001BDABF9E|nr:hypothetical protein [Acrocarpospora catenulata]